MVASTFGQIAHLVTEHSPSTDFSLVFIQIQFIYKCFRELDLALELEGGGGVGGGSKDGPINE